MMTFGFTILHYLDAEVTEKCVRSLIAISKDSSVYILIVDNGSNNGSGEILQSIFKDEPLVSVLQLEKNLGFAGGNNAGFAWLKEKCNPDFIICSNNDVIFTQQNFMKSIEQSYEDYHFDVMGPDIIDANGKEHLNPHHLGSVTEKHVRKSLSDIRLPFAIYKTGILIPLFEFYKRRKKYAESQILDYTVANLDCILQGSCIIYSQKFILTHKRAFCSYTFLYYEEYILKMIIDSEKGCMVYDPHLQIVHLGGRSTGKALGKGRKKTVFLMRQYIRSWKAWLRVFEELKQGINPLK